MGFPTIAKDESHTIPLSQTQTKNGSETLTCCFTSKTRGVYSILAMKQIASFASLGGLKNDTVFASWGNIMLGLYNDKSMRNDYF